MCDRPLPPRLGLPLGALPQGTHTSLRLLIPIGPMSTCNERHAPAAPLVLSSGNETIMPTVISERDDGSLPTTSISERLARAAAPAKFFKAPLHPPVLQSFTAVLTWTAAYLTILALTFAAFFVWSHLTVTHTVDTTIVRSPSDAAWDATCKPLAWYDTLSSWPGTPAQAATNSAGGFSALVSASMNKASCQEKVYSSNFCYDFADAYVGGSKCCITGTCDVKVCGGTILVNKTSGDPKFPIDSYIMQGLRRSTGVLNLDTLEARFLDYGYPNERVAGYPVPWLDTSAVDMENCHLSSNCSSNVWCTKVYPDQGCGDEQPPPFCNDYPCSQGAAPMAFSSFDGFGIKEFAPSFNRIALSACSLPNAPGPLKKIFHLGITNFCGAVASGPTQGILNLINFQGQQKTGLPLSYPQAQGAKCVKSCLSSGDPSLCMSGCGIEALSGSKPQHISFADFVSDCKDALGAICEKMETYSAPYDARKCWNPIHQCPRR